MGMGENMTNAPHIMGGGYGYGDGGGGWLGMLLVIALLGGRGFGFGGHDGHDGGKGNDIERMMLMQQDNNNSRFNQLTSEINHIDTNNFQRSLAAEIGRLGFDNAIIAKNAEIEALRCCCNTNSNIDQLRFNTAIETMKTNQNISDCCCTTNRNIDSVKFENCQNTGAIIGAINAASQRQIDWLTCNEMKEAYAKIAALEADKNKLEIISAMKPVAPVPAYIQANPFENFVPRVNCEPRRCDFDNCHRGFA